MSETVPWSPTTVGIELSSNEVHIWRAFLDIDPAIRHKLATLLSNQERERAARYFFARDRNRFSVARAILRQLLGGYLSERPQDVVLETLSYGKPILAPTARIPSLRFNVSHSREFALFAFCLEREVGIDIEQIRPQVAFEGIESHYFSPEERAELETLPRDLRPEAFFLCWTRKEAYVKATGEGLKVPLESFSVSLTPGNPVVLQSSDKERWSLYSLNPTAGFVGALAAEGRGHRLQLWDWNESNS